MHAVVVCCCPTLQGRIDARTMSGARMITECSSLLLAGVLVLSALGININALLLPTGVVLAIASKDLLQNLIAGKWQAVVACFRSGWCTHAWLWLTGWPALVNA
jgi:hypothetical protein